MIERKFLSKHVLFLLIAGAAMLLMTVQPSLAAYLATPNSYWQLEETNPLATGVANDIPSAITGTCIAGVCPTSGTGVVDNCFVFDGTNDAVDFADNAVFDFEVATSFSIEFWVKRDGHPATNEAAIGRFGGGTDAVWFVGIDTNGMVVADFWDADGPYTSNSLNGYTDVTDDQWHHVVVVRDAGNEKLMIYVDGVLEAVLNTTGNANFDGSFDTSAIVTMGEFNNTWQLEGSLDNVAIYNATVLPTATIAQLYRNGASGNDLQEEFAPVFIGSGSATISLSLVATLEARAAGNPLPSYSSTDLPTGGSIEASTGDITWLPADTQVGTTFFNVMASNSVGPAAAAQSWAVNVEDLCASSLDAHWKFEETDPLNEGVADDTSVVPDGTCTAGVCPGSLDPAKVGLGFTFDGTNDAVDFADNAVFDFEVATSFSIEFWVKRDGHPATNEAAIGRFGGVTDAVWFVGIDTNGMVVADFWDADGPHTSNSLNGHTDVTDDQWHHVVVVRDAGNEKLMIYVDGVLEAVLNTTGNANFDGSFDTSAIVTMGEFNNTWQLEGSLDEVAIYNDVLAPAVINQHVNADADRYYCNGAPSITSTEIDTATEGTLYEYNATADDPDNDDIVWSLTTFPSGMTINSTNGEIDWDLGDNPPASANVTILASDQYGGTATQAFVITVTQQNDAPVITDQNIVSTPEETARAITLADLIVTDPDNTYPTDFTLTVQDGSNYTRSGAEITPVSDFNGTLSVPVSVNDGEATSNVYNLQVTVSADNDDPEITSTGPTTATEGDVYTYSATATDADVGDTLTWSLSGAPTGMSVDANTGEVTWTPAASHVGDISYTLTVSDGNGGSDSEVVTVTVSAAASSGGGGGSSGGCFIGTLNF